MSILAGATYVYLSHFRNELSASEQVSVAEELSVSISQQLGLREQLEVISIINPAAAVRPADTQFVIGERECQQSRL